MNDAWLVPALAGVFGLLLGSFLNVCALRWGPEPAPGEKRQSVVFPGSRCPNCETPLSWYDNVPVLSWLVLRGRCRHCANPISIQYPIVELTTGLIWAGSFASFGAAAEAGRGAIFLTILLGISVTDARFYVIPDEFSVGGAVVGLALSFAPGGIGWLDALLGGAIGYSVLLLIGVVGTWAIKRLSPGRLEAAGVEQAMGGGDIKMMMMIGAFLGPWGVALTVFLGSILALLVFGPISAISKRLIPLGVFLAAGGGVAYAFGDALVRWYLTSVVGLPG